jgi:3-oxoacyl-[acyl-carrier protein] reductase
MDAYRDLEGKTALVTGSGRNIGRAVLLELAAKGADVIVNVRSNKDEAEHVASEARAYGVRAIVCIGDVSRQETVDQIADAAGAEFGGIDIVVSSAAVRPVQSFFELPIEDWQTILNTQLTASFRLAKAFVPGMTDRQWGRIIHITGPDAFIGLPHRAHNVTAKGGLRALTKALAIELGPFGITVNDVAPGNIRSLRDDASHPVVGSVPAPDRQAGVADIPVGRQGEPEDVAYACGFLASPRAGFYTGTAMHCFGGQWNLG